MSDTPCLEAAISTAKDPTSFEKLQQQAHLDLATFPGFISSIALRNLENSAIHADLILWASETSALSSAKVIQQDERFSDFMQSIESVEHFAHYNGAFSEAMNQLVKSPVIEITAYKTMLESNITGLRSSIYRSLRNMEGVSSQVAGTDIDDASALLDLIGWKDKALSETAPSLLMKNHPEVEAFFSNVGEIDVKALFEVVT